MNIKTIFGVIFLAAVIFAMTLLIKVPKAGAPQEAPAPIIEIPTSLPKLPADSPAAPSAESVVGITWEWKHTVKEADSIITPRKAGAFTMTLTADGKVNGTTDCNGFGGDYQLASDGILTFGPFMSTLMFCEGSQEPEFVADITNVGRAAINSEGDLVLLLKDDQGAVVFKKQ